MEQDETYLIWSNEHQAWWRTGARGYTDKVEEAGHYSEQEAVKRCAHAVPGTAMRMGVLPEMPVRLADLVAISGLVAPQWRESGLLPLPRRGKG